MFRIACWDCYLCHLLPYLLVEIATQNKWAKRGVKTRERTTRERAPPWHKGHAGLKPPLSVELGIKLKTLTRREVPCAFLALRRCGGVPGIARRWLGYFCWRVGGREVTSAAERKYSLYAGVGISARRLRRLLGCRRRSRRGGLQPAERGGSTGRDRGG